MSTAAALAVITDVAWDDVEVERGVLAPAGIELIDGSQMSDAELRTVVRSADAILTCWRRVDASLLADAQRCVTVSRYGVGLDNIDVVAATDLGMIVTNVPDYCTEEVSDHTLALILSRSRRLSEYRDQTRAGGWDNRQVGPLHRLSSQTIGLIGYGHIGRRVADKAAAMGLRVVAWTPRTVPGTTDGATEFVSFADLLATSDYVSLHAPLTDSSHHLLGTAELAAMRPGAYLVNTARGGLIDTDALVDALLSGRLSGAGLDVTESEPPAVDHPLRAIDSVTLTPHAAFSSVDAMREVARRAATHAASALSGTLPDCVVNPEVLQQANLRISQPGR
jgi:D-3-phosphoglycerate dehydrogenase / 2-oxoglutarate reductase